MQRAWVEGKEYWCRFALVFLLAAGCAAFARAQESSKPQASAPRTIILPQRLVAGAPSTLAVLDAGGRLTANAEVELSTGQKITTDATGRALFVAPLEAGALTAKVSEQETTALATVVISPNSTWPNPVDGSVNQSHSALSFPHAITLHDRFTIEGQGFSGHADANRVWLADRPCLVVASSPLTLVVLPGLHVPIGTVALRVNANGHDAGSFPVKAVALEFTGPAQAPNAGAQSTLILHVRGTTDRLEVEVRNGSPEIVQLIHGNVQRLRTSGGKQNTAPVDLKLLAPGNYVVTARLLPSESESSDTGAILQILRDGRELASGNWNSRIGRVVARVDQPPEHVPEIRAELKDVLDDKPAGQLASDLDSAWRLLN